MATTTAYFTAATFSFLRDLAANNDRTWFAEHKERYEQHVREPALRFIADFEKPLRAISRHFVAEPSKSGGSLFRIHRDTRFAKDKSPYKTYTGIQFRHEDGKDAHAPCFYLHLQPREVFVGCGMWHPDGDALAKIREAIARDPSAWTKTRDAASFRKVYRLGGETLKRPPRGYDPEHPCVEDLKRKDFIAVADLTQKDVTGAGVLDRFATLCRAGVPLQRFLCKAIGVAY